MFIIIKNQLEYIKEDLESKRPVEEIPISGTLAVIDGSMDFRKPDGFIQFMKLALDYVSVACGKQHPKWQACLDRIYACAEKLQSAQTQFTGSTKEEFVSYCKKLSHVMDNDMEPLKVLHFDIAKEDDLVPFMEKHTAKGNIRGFYYEPEEDSQKELMHDLMDQLSRIKFEKESARNYDISGYLTRSGYHEHVHDALNVIIGTVVYAINCSSTKKQEAYSFDTQKVYNDLRYAELIMKRTESVI